VAMATAALPARVLRLVISAGLSVSAVGLLLGVAIALATTHLLGDLLFRVSPRDPVVLVAVVLLMAVWASMACVIPAWRASRLDPVRALRA